MEFVERMERLDCSKYWTLDESESPDGSSYVERRIVDDINDMAWHLKADLAE